MIFAVSSLGGMRFKISFTDANTPPEELHHNTAWIQQSNPPIVSQLSIFVNGLTRLPFMRGSGSCLDWSRASPEKLWSEVNL